MKEKSINTKNSFEVYSGFCIWNYDVSGSDSAGGFFYHFTGLSEEFPEISVWRCVAVYSGSDDHRICNF